MARARKQKTVTMPTGVETQWVCGVPVGTPPQPCNNYGLPDQGVTLLDPRYAPGVCPVHGRTALHRREPQVSPLRAAP